MSPTDNPMDFFRTMKGAPHSVLSVLAYIGRPMTNRELQLWTGYHADTITRVTHDLIQRGWLEACTPIGPWSLARGRVMPGMAGQAPAAMSGAGVDADRAERPRENPVGDPGDLSRARASENSAWASENSASPSEFSGSPSSTGWLEDGHPEKEPEEDPSYPPEPVLGHPNFSEALKALEEAGVDEPIASRIARLRHVSADYVRAHVGARPVGRQRPGRGDLSDATRLAGCCQEAPGRAQATGRGSDPPVSGGIGSVDLMSLRGALAPVFVRSSDEAISTTIREGIARECTPWRAAPERTQGRQDLRRDLRFAPTSSLPLQEDRLQSPRRSSE